jgi:hypothetical protein
MTTAVPARSLRLVGWAFPILAVLCCAPSAARAGCGDYVVTRAAPPGNAASAAHPAEMPSPAPAAPHKPCHGPNCSGAPAVPQPVPPSVTPNGPTEWGWLAATPSSAPSHAGAVLAESSSPDPTHLASGIFHPPRTAA